MSHFSDQNFERFADKVRAFAADHPHADPGDGRTECETCGKWVFQVIHSCKGVPVTAAAQARFDADPEAWIAKRARRG